MTGAGSTALAVAAGETGLIRVVAPGPVAAGDPSDLLGGPALAPKAVETVEMADLHGLGLSGYLAQGHDVAPEALDGDGPRLDALTGRVFLVFSAAFAGQAATLRPAPGVQVFGPYAEARADAARPVPPPREAPVVLAPPRQPAPPAHAPHLPLALLALVGLPVLALLIWWLT